MNLHFSLLCVFIIVMYYINLAAVESALNTNSFTIPKLSTSYTVPFHKFMKQIANIIPEHYDLTITVDDLNKNTFSGKVKIKFSVESEEVDELYLSTASNMVVSKVKITDESDQSEVNALGYMVNAAEYYKIVPGQKLFRNSYCIEIEYVGFINEDDEGIYKYSFTDEDNNRQMFILTNFSNGKAKKALPCLSDTVHKSTFSIVLNHKPELKALSITRSTEEIENNLQTDTFEKTSPMHLHDIAFIIGPLYDCNDDDSTKFKMWATRTSPSNIYTAKVAAHLFNHCEKYLGVDYPFLELNFVSIPNLRENFPKYSGLLIFKEETLHEQLSKTDTNFEYFYNISEVIVHQWFNCVPHKYREPEKFFKAIVQYVKLVIFGQSFPTYNAINKDTLLSVVKSMNISDLPHSLKDVHHGILIVRMIATFLGENIFSELLQRYLNGSIKNSGDSKPIDLNTLMTDLPEAANFFDDTILMEEKEERSGIRHRSMTVVDLFRLWLPYSYPVVYISWSQEKNSIISSVKKQEVGIIQKTYTYDIPIPVMYSLGADNEYDMIWLISHENDGLALLLPEDETKQVIDKNGPPLIVNDGATVYSRIIYDDILFDKFLSILTNDCTTIPEINRMQFLEDYTYFAKNRINSHPYSNVRKLLSYLPLEPEYLPLCIGVKVAYELDNMFMDTPYHSEFRAFITNIFLPIIHRHKTNFLELPENTNFDLLTPMIFQLACVFEIENVIQDVKDYFERWRKDSQGEIFLLPTVSEVRNYTIFCTAIRHGTEETWEFVLSVYNRTNLQNFQKVTILAALGCSKDVTNLKWLRNMLTYQLNWDIKSVFTTGIYCPPFIPKNIFEDVITLLDNFSLFYLAKDFFFSADTFITVPAEYQNIPKYVELVATHDIKTDDKLNKIHRVLSKNADENARFILNKINIWRTKLLNQVNQLLGSPEKVQNPLF